MLQGVQEPDSKQKVQSPASFGRNMKMVRGGLGLTQQQFSDSLARLGLKLDTSAITRIENGSREPRLTEAQIIAQALGVDLGDLLARDSKLVMDKLWMDLDDRRFDLVDAVYDYGVARRALREAIDELDEQRLTVDNIDKMRRDVELRAITDWHEIKADVRSRMSDESRPPDETVFDAEA